LNNEANIYYAAGFNGSGRHSWITEFPYTVARRVRLKIEIHEIHEIHLMCEIHMPKYRNPIQVCDIHCQTASCFFM